MKNIKKLLGTVALVALTSVASAQFTTNLFPNGDFSSSSTITNPSPEWVEVSGGGTFGYGYPTSGGNPGDYGVITNTGAAGWGIWVGGDATPLPLESLGLVPGQTYTFLQDMITLAGTNTGGLKMESWGPSGGIGLPEVEMRPLTWTTNGWATYAFNYTIKPGATGIKVVPLWGVNSTVGYDNFRVRVPLTLPFTAQITSPTNGATVFSNFIITATASLLPGTVTNVDFFRGNTLLGSDDTLPYNLYVTDAALGAAALTVVAKADTGASVTSSVVNVTVSATPVVNTFDVNPAAAWLGFMNVFQTPQNFNGFVFGQPWGVADLSAAFSGSGASSVLTLKPAPMNDTAIFWYDYDVPPLAGGPIPADPGSMPGAVGYKEMEANLYVELAAGTVNGNLVTFGGTCVTNTLDITLNPSSVNGIGNGWTNYAFVKELSGNTIVNASYVTLSNGLPFSVSLQTTPDPMMTVQYGFVTRGPNVWPTDVDDYGMVQVQAIAAAATNVIVDSAANWAGYMNVFANPQGGGGYVFGSPWGTADLSAVFNSSGLVLSPNTIGDPSPEWYSPSGGPGAVGNRTMEANFYQEFTGPLAGQNVTFSGTVLANTLVAASNTNALGNGWTAVAFIRDFAPDYSSFNSATVPLTPGAFSVSLSTSGDPARHVQYGFQVVGPNVWVTDVAPFGNIVIENAGIAPTTIIPSLNGANINLTFATQVGKTYTVQYKNALTDPTWQTLTTINGTGANAIVVDPANGSQRFYQLSIQ
jgi:hypothetical protein